MTLRTLLKMDIIPHDLCLISKAGTQFLILSLLIIVTLPLFAATIPCTSPYKGTRFNLETLKPLLDAHQAWLKKGASSNQPGQLNLCGTELLGLDLSGQDLQQSDFSGSDMSRMKLQNVNLSASKLVKTFFRWSNLSKANLEAANLQGADFEHAVLKQANFRRANLTDANFSHANLQFADLRATNLTGANLSDADLKGAVLNYATLRHANLSHANLVGAVLENARLQNGNLSEANLTKANLAEANLSHANFNQTVIKAVDFRKTNFKNVLFQPKLGGLPDLISLATARHFSTIRFSDTQGIAALIELRNAYKRLGMRSMERTITAMVKTKQMYQQWERGGWGRFESIMNYVLFYITSDLGASPGRALRALVLIILLLSIPYWLTLAVSSRRHGVIVTWTVKRYFPAGKARDPEQRHELSMMLKKHPVEGWSATIKEHWRLIKIALFFSVLSSFTIGWRDLNVSHWILRLQSRPCVFKAKGWIRILSGFQSIISAYLIVLWALTYFGSPFEW